MLTYIKSPRNGSVCYFSSKLDVPSNVVQKKRVARILFFKIRPSQNFLKIRDGTPLREILKIRDGTPLEAEEILTYIKCPRNGSVCYFSSKLDVSSNVVQKKKVARVLFFKIRSSQGILKVLVRILFFKIRRSQEILKIRDGTPLEAEEILTYIKCPRNGSVCYFSSKLDVSSNVVQKKKVARILFFKIKPSQEILKIRDGTPLEAEEILTYIKCPRNGLVCYFSSKLDVSSNVVQKKKVARIMFFKIRSSQGILKIRDGAPMEMPSQEILKIRDGTPLEMSSQGILKVRDCTPMEAEEILTYIKSPRNGSKRVARILFFKIRSSQEILKIRDGTPLEAEEMLTYIKSPRNGSVCYFSSKLDVPSNVVQKKRVARILFFKIRPSQKFLKIRDGTPLRVARVLFFKIRPSQEILKIRDGTPLEAEEILTYIKCPRNGSVCYFSSKLDVSSNVVQKKKVARVLFFKIRSSQGILKVRDCTPMELDVPSNVVQNKRVARVLFFKIRPSQEILKIRDGTPLEAEEILTYIKCPRNGSVCYFSSKLDVSSNVVQKKKVARILFFKIRSSQGILKVRDCTPMEKKRVVRILFFKIRPSQEILKIRDGTPLEAEEILTYMPSKRIGLSSQGILKVRDCTPMEAEEILTYIKSPRNGSKRVARILFFKIKPSQEILKIRDGTPLEAEEILTYIKCPRNGLVCYFSSKLDVSSNVVQKKKVARIMFFKIRSSQGILKIRDGAPMEMPSQEILKIRDGTPLEMSSQEILKIRDGTPLEAEEMLTYIKSPRNGSVCYFSSKLDVPSNVVQKKRVARILFFKIRPSQKFLKIRDGTPLRGGGNFYIHKKPSKWIVARVLFFKIRPSQEILKIRDGTPLEAEEILTYIKCPRNGSVCYFSSKLDVSSNVVQKKKVARILFFKIRSSQGILKMPSQEILKIRDGTPLEAEEILTYMPSKRIVARILFFKIRSSQGILKVRDCTPMEAEEILTYIKRPRNVSVCYFSSKLDVPSNVVQNKRVARVLFFKIRPSQEILKIRDGTPLEAEEILTYIKCPRNGSVCYFSSKLDVSSNVVQKKKVARILFFKIRSSQGILKVRDCTPMEKKRVVRILFFKIRPSQEILKIRDGTPLEAEEILTYMPSKRIGILKVRDCTPMEAEEILTYIKSPRNGSKSVARILFFKIRSSQEILKIRDGTPLEAEEMLTYIKSPRNGSVCYFSSKLDVPSNVVQKKRVARILFFKIRSSQGILKVRDCTPMEMPSQEILKIRDGTPLEAEEILTYMPSKRIVARILFFKIRSSQGILKVRDCTPMEAEEILTYIKSPRNGSVCYFSSKLDVPSNVVQKKSVARILFFKIRSSQEILKIRDGTPLEAEEMLTYIKSPRNGSVCYFSSKLDVPSNVVQKKRVARILFFKIRSSQGILKVRDCTPMEMPSQEILKIRDGHLKEF
ncbi:hypothetical protein OROMI_024810 [Orobanche minor]